MKKKLIVILIISLAFILSININSAHINAESNASQSAKPIITNTKNYILANVGEIVNLSEYRVRGSFGETTLNNVSLTSSHASVNINNGTLTISEKGIFKTLMSYQSVSMDIYVITKLAGETEFVIYSEDFSYPNGSLPASLTLLSNQGSAGGSAAIDNGRLLLSPSTIVLFPSYLQGFSNYIIEADMRMISAANTSRWTSVMFRYQTENYYQMAIRQNATANNGVEFAKRIEGNWNVPAIASYSTALDPATTYNLKIDVFETTIKEYINNQMIINYDGAFEFEYGRIGVQADNVSVYYDNIKITLPEDYVVQDRFQFTQITDVYQPQTGIVMPATTIAWFNNITQLDIAQETKRPATMVFKVDQDLNVINDDNVSLSLLEALIAIDGKIIPAVYTNSIETAEKLAEFFKSNRIIDCFIVSDDKEVILAAKAVHNVFRGVLNFPMSEKTSLTNSDLMNVRFETNVAQAVASILPSHLVDKKMVEYMQIRAMTVWVTAESDPISQYRAILSGANGIVTQDYNKLFDIYKTFQPNTHVRRPLLIAHRGLYNGLQSSAPENTIEVALEAYRRGADIIELDVHITLDLEPVVIHDATTARTAPNYQSVTVQNSLLDDLKDLHLNDPVGGRTDIRIPTLREFMEAFKGKDVVLFIEIKPTQPLLVEMVAEIIKELDMYDQSCIIAFAAANISKMNEVMPEISNGFLSGAVLNAANVNSSITNAISTIIPINSTLNPHYGALTKEFMNAATHRGITVWPWTINDLNHFFNYYNLGVNGITTDYMQYIENTFDRIEFQSYNHTYTLEEAINTRINAEINTSNGTVYPFMPTFTIVDDGNTGIVFDQNGNINSVEREGKVYIFTTFANTMPNGANFIITSDLIEINIENPKTNLSLIVALSSIMGAVIIISGSFYGYKLLKSKRIKIS